MAKPQRHPPETLLQPRRRRAGRRCRSAGDDAAKAEARAKVVAAAKAKAEAAKAAKAAAGGGAEAGAAGAKPAAKPKHEPAGDQPPWNVDPTAPEWKDEAEDALVKALHAKHPGGITSARSFAEISRWW